MFSLFASKQALKANGRRFYAAAFKPDAAKGAAFAKSLDENMQHSAAASATWKKITMALALPAILIALIPVYRVEEEHAKHRKVLKTIPDDKWPKEYSYQNVRRNKFFWGDGDKTVFWNQGVNRHIKNE